MKKLILFLTPIILLSCNSNPDYKRNLANAQKLFELHGQEDLDAQISLVSKDIKSIPPLYGSKPMGYDSYIQMLKGYHEAFDNIKYTAEVWLPGTDDNGNFDGSVRTYGNWTGTNVATGKELNLNGYWYFNFDKNGLVTEQGDFFDAGGMFNAVYDVNHPDEIMNVVNMTVKKSAAEVENFVAKYQNLVNRLEPNSLSFKFTKTGKNEVTLIERYTNSDALITHIKNISPDGAIAKDFEEFQDTFKINYITLYGDSSDKLKAAIAPFQIKTSYVPLIAGYSR